MEYITLNKEDSERLIETINAVEGVSGLISAEANNEELVSILTKNYVKELSNHRAVWYAILLKYIGDSEKVSKNLGRYRYDVIKNVIFMMDSTCTCGECE